jgi:hypothetical protein
MWKIASSMAALLGLTPGATGSEPAVVGTIDVAKVPPYDKPKKNFGQSHNMSGLFCPGPDWCVMVSDELKGIHRLKVDRSGDLPAVSYDVALTLDPPSPAFLGGHGMAGNEMKELDLEAIASAGNKVIFVGSHANKRNSGEPNPTAHLVAIADLDALKANAAVAAEWTSLDGLFRRADMFPDALYRQLQCGGINIEGATVFEGDLLIGLRSPTRGTKGFDPGAYVVSTPLAGLVEEDFSEARLHVLATEAPFIGIRAMATIGDTVLMVTGDAGVNDLEDEIPECGANLNMEDPARPFQLRAWKPKEGDRLKPEVLFVFPEREEQEFESTETSLAKVEGIALAGEAGATVSLFVVYDGSAHIFYLPEITLPQ